VFWVVLRAFCFYLPLIGSLARVRPAVVESFYGSLLPIAALHVTLLLTLTLIWRARVLPAVILWECLWRSSSTGGTGRVVVFAAGLLAPRR